VPEWLPECVDVCPTDAIQGDGALAARSRRCLFCTECVNACPEGAIAFTRTTDWRHGGAGNLVLSGQPLAPGGRPRGETSPPVGRSLSSASSVPATATRAPRRGTSWGRLAGTSGGSAIQYGGLPASRRTVYSSRARHREHAAALRKTYDRGAAAEIVIAVGCAISGGPYAGHPEQHDGAASVLPWTVHSRLPPASAQRSSTACCACWAARGGAEVP